MTNTKQPGCEMCSRKASNRIGKMPGVWLCGTHANFARRRGINRTRLWTRVEILAALGFLYPE